MLDMCLKGLSAVADFVGGVTSGIDQGFFSVAS
jgi:hypothetical protein